MLNRQLNRRNFLAACVATTGMTALPLRAAANLLTDRTGEYDTLVLAQASTTHLDPIYQRQLVPFPDRRFAGQVVIDVNQKFLYLVRPDQTALRYGIGVGRDGFKWHGVAQVARKKAWPAWHPPAEMREREPYLPEKMEGGLNNPLGARALYLHDADGRDTLYRIHGTNEPDTIGQAVSSGCIRLLNADVIDIYRRVPIGTKVVAHAPTAENTITTS